MTEGPDYGGACAPALAEFEELAGAGLAAAAGEFRGLCGDVLIRIEDFRHRGGAARPRTGSPFDLMGLYQGVSQTRKASWTCRAGRTWYFFTGPLLDYWAEGNETLGHLVTHVLVHEIGHHLASDADMVRIDEFVVD